MRSAVKTPPSRRKSWSAFEGVHDCAEGGGDGRDVGVLVGWEFVEVLVDGLVGLDLVLMQSRPARSMATKAK